MVNINLFRKKLFGELELLKKKTTGAGATWKKNKELEQEKS